MPATGLIAPGKEREAWLTFDRRLIYVPHSLEYVDGAQTVEVRFEGKHKSELRS